MNSDDYVKLLKQNVLRLKADGDFLQQGNRNLTAVFCYITMTEEFFKLARFLDEKQVQRVKGHFSKLQEINHIFQKRVNVLKSEQNRNYIASGMLDTIHTTIDDIITTTSDTKQRTALVEFKQTLSSPGIFSELNSTITSGLVDLSSQLERCYSNRIRELCLYVDWNETPLDEKEIVSILKMYSDISAGIVTFMETMV